MISQINYGNLSHSIWIKKKLYSEVKKIEQKFNFNKPTDFKVWVNNNNPSESPGPPEYTCTIQFNCGREHYNIFKFGINFYVCINKAFKALAEKINKNHKYLLKKRNSIQIESYADENNDYNINYHKFI